MLRLLDSVLCCKDQSGTCKTQEQTVDEIPFVGLGLCADEDLACISCMVFVGEWLAYLSSPCIPRMTKRASGANMRKLQRLPTRIRTNREGYVLAKLIATVLGMQHGCCRRESRRLG
jgi:hypothetical protein